MAGALGKFVGGFAQGLSQGLMAEAEQKRQAALLEIERNYRRQDAEYEHGLRTQEAETEAGRRDKAEESRREFEGGLLSGTAEEEGGNLVGYTRKGERKELGIKTAPKATDAEPLEETYDDKTGEIRLTPRSQARGLLSKANKPTASGAEKQIQPADVAGRIMNKMAMGEPLTPAEQKAFDAYLKMDPFRAMLANAMGGGAGGAGGGLFDNLTPGGPPAPPKPAGPPAGAVAIPKEAGDVLSAPDGSIIEDDATGAKFRKQGGFLIPVQ
jgi:hypothetical protein